MPNGNSGKDTSQPLSSDVAQERHRFVQRLIEGLNKPTGTTPPDFSVLPNVSLTKAQRKKKIYSDIADEAHKAIIHGDRDRLVALLGPAEYPGRQKNNRDIYHMRWKWLDAQTCMDAYEQLFKIVLGYARRPICERYMQTVWKTLKDNVHVLESELQKSKYQYIYYPSKNFNPEEWTALPNNGGYLLKPYPKNFYYHNESIRSPEEIEYHLAKAHYQLNVTNTYFQRYEQERSILNMMAPQEALRDFEKMILVTNSQETLNRMYETACHNSVPVLDTKERMALKAVLIDCLKALPKQRNIHIESLLAEGFEQNIKKDAEGQEHQEPQTRRVASYSTETIVTQVSPISYNSIVRHIKSYAYVRPEIQENIEQEIEHITLMHSNLSHILDCFYKNWDYYAKEVDRLEERYRNLVNANSQRNQEALLKAEYYELPALGGVEKDSPLEMGKIKKEAVIKSEIGKLSLADIALSKEPRYANAPALAASLLRYAVEGYRRQDITQSERNQRIDIAVLLVRRGCSPFLLPEFTPSHENADDRVSQHRLPWRVLIELLNSLVCITPTADAIRNACLAYAQDEHADGKIGADRNQSIIRLAQLLHQSQNPENLNETELLEMVETHIKQAPRGFLSRSNYCNKLKEILDNVEHQKIMAIKVNNETKMDVKNGVTEVVDQDTADAASTPSPSKPSASNSGWFSFFNSSKPASSSQANEADSHEASEPSCSTRL